MPSSVQGRARPLPKPISTPKKTDTTAAHNHTHAEGGAKFGHLPYTEVPLAERKLMKPIGKNFLLKAPAAEAYLRMVDAAKAEGITLVPAFGFRDLKTQKALFNYNTKIPEAQRAKQRAPPGHSEHHTGYALDINSKGEKMTENSKAYQWLKKHAAAYGFENSFPKNNKQGVMFEPWHWRYIGNEESLKIFERARQLTGQSDPGWKPNQ